MSDVGRRKDIKQSERIGREKGKAKHTRTHAHTTVCERTRVVEVRKVKARFSYLPAALACGLGSAIRKKKILILPIKI